MTDEATLDTAKDNDHQAHVYTTPDALAREAVRQSHGCTRAAAAVHVAGLNPAEIDTLVKIADGAKPGERRGEINRLLENAARRREAEARKREATKRGLDVDQVVAHVAEQNKFLADLKVNDLTADKVTDAFSAAVGRPVDPSEKVEDLKAEIAAGTYETAERLDGAVDRLLTDLDATPPEPVAEAPALPPTQATPKKKPLRR